MPPVPLEFAEVARKLLASELGAGPPASSSEVAAATVRVWEKLAKHFAMLVGEMGVRTLLDRSVFLASATHPWLAGSGGLPRVAPTSDAPWAPLQAVIEGQEPVRAAGAIETLIATFVGLVGRFIGHGLVARLLQEVWPELFPRDAKESHETPG
jgi:hypothetical protein